MSFAEDARKAREMGLSYGECVGCPLIVRCSNDPSFQPPFFARCQQETKKE